MRVGRAWDPSTGEPCRVLVVGEDDDVRYRRIDATIEELHDFDGEIPIGEPFVPESLPLAPVIPGKVVCVGLNYVKHAAEQGKAVPAEPLIFMKPPSAVIGPGESIELPPQSELVHHEGELAIVIGRRTRKVSVAHALDHVFGYTCAVDVSARDIQRREKRYTRAKGFDTFCPLGPYIATADVFVPAEHRLELRVNDEVRQASQLDDFIFDVPTVVSFISHVMTLEPGDVVLTGTPHGVAPIVDGDLVNVSIDGIGTLVNPVVSGS